MKLSKIWILLLFYSFLTKSYCQSTDSFFNKGSSDIKEKNYEEAIENLSRSIELNPENEQAYFLRAFAKVHLRQCEKAIDYYNTKLSKNPGSNSELIARYHLTGNAIEEPLYKQGPITNCYYANQKDPIFLNLVEQAYQNRSEGVEIPEDYQDAMKDYDTAIELNPEWINALFNRGNLKVLTGDYKGAIIDYSSIIAMNKVYAPAYTARGLAKESIQSYESAIEDYTTAINYYLDFVEIYTKQGNDALLNQMLTGVIETYYARSAVRIIIGDKEAAATDLKFAQDYEGIINR